MRLLAAACAVLLGPDPAELRAGLDILYAGRFQAAERYFAQLGAAYPHAAAPLVFQAGALIWRGASLERPAYGAATIDSLLERAIARAREAGDAFWLATGHGYRGRQRELRGDPLGAAHDARRMHEQFRRVLARDSTCADCLLGLGLYQYGLARAGTLARTVARLIGLGGGDAAAGIRAIRRAAEHGDLARVEATWVLAAALVREAARDPGGRAVLLDEARRLARALARRHPDNPVFTRFVARLREPFVASGRP